MAHRVWFFLTRIKILVLLQTLAVVVRYSELYSSVGLQTTKRAKKITLHIRTCS